ARAGVLVQHDAFVVGMVAVVAAPHDLYVVQVDEQRDEQDRDGDGHLAYRLVHAGTACRSFALGGGVVAGRRAASDTRNRIASRIQLPTSDEPPKDRNGDVSPVSGSSRVTPATTTKTCSAM